MISSSEMRMENPVPTFTYVVEQLVAHHSNLAYLHVIEPRVNGTFDTEAKRGEV